MLLHVNQKVSMTPVPFLKSNQDYLNTFLKIGMIVYGTNTSLRRKCNQCIYLDIEYFKLVLTTGM